MSGTWTRRDLLTLLAVILFVLAFIAAMDWVNKVTNPTAWMLAGLAVFAASFLPWRNTP